jgi:hypothetical protein
MQLVALKAALFSQFFKKSALFAFAKENKKLSSPLRLVEAQEL